MGTNMHPRVSSQKFVRQIGDLVRRLCTNYVARVCEDDLENLFEGQRRQAVEEICNAHDSYEPDVADLVELVKQSKGGYQEIKAWMFDADILSVAEEIGYTESDGPDLVEAIMRALQAWRAADVAVMKLAEILRQMRIQDGCEG